MSSRTQDRPGPRPGHAETVRRLAAAQKSGKGAPAYSRYVNRRLGRHLAAAAYRLGLTPDAVTAVSGVTTFAGIALLATGSPSWWLGVVVCLLLVLGYALDAADGQLARLRGGGSLAGEWLDHMVDSAKVSSLHLAVLLALHRVEQVPDAWLLVPLGYAVVAAVSFFAQILNEQLLRSRGRERASGAGRASAVVSLLKAPTDYGLLCLVFLLLGAPLLFLGVYTLMLVASGLYLLLALVRWHGQIRALDVERAATSEEPR